MSDGSSTAARDARRHADNERSLAWATKRNEVWTDEDDMVILEQWILVTACVRDEEAISKLLKRTIFACQRRAEALRAELNVSRESPSKHKSEPEYVGKDDTDDDQWWSPDYYTNAQPNQ